MQNTQDPDKTSQVNSFTGDWLKVKVNSDGVFKEKM